MEVGGVVAEDSAFRYRFTFDRNVTHRDARQIDSPSRMPFVDRRRRPPRLDDQPIAIKQIFRIYPRWPGINRPRTVN